MITLVNTHQKEVVIDFECPHCKKTIKAYKISDLPYPSYETSKEIESERHKNISIVCPKCSKTTSGDIFASHKNIYLNLTGDYINLIEDDNKNEKIESYIFISFLGIKNNLNEIIKAYNNKNDDSQLHKLAKELLLSLRFLDTVKGAYAIEDDIIDEICESYNKFKKEHWKEIELLSESKKLRDNLISLVQDVSLLIDKWVNKQLEKTIINYRK